jgi:pSer/pThr/pTyr-binding forkhead associated (FHA) protein
MENENQSNRTDSIKEQDIELIREISQELLDQLSNIPKDRAGLMVIKGPNPGEKFFISKPVLTIGRNRDSDILLDDITVSRNHAVIEKTDGQFKLKDQESLNGTYLNGEIVENSVLSTGDRIQIGKYLFLFFSS